MKYSKMRHLKKFNELQDITINNQMRYPKKFNENIGNDPFNKEDLYRIYIDYYGKGYDDELFELLYSDILRDYNEGGLMNIPNEVKLSRLINLRGSFSEKNNIHWVRREDEYLSYDNDWIFLSDVNIRDNPKIIRSTMDSINIDINKTISQNITFPSEKEISIRSDVKFNYEIVDY